MSYVPKTAYVDTIGDTMTGSLAVDAGAASSYITAKSSAYAEVRVDGPTAQAIGYGIKKVGSRQWYLVSLANSNDLAISRYVNDTYTDIPFRVNANGEVRLAANPVNALGVATKQYVDGLRMVPAFVQRGTDSGAIASAASAGFTLTAPGQTIGATGFIVVTDVSSLNAGTTSSKFINAFSSTGADITGSGIQETVQLNEVNVTTAYFFATATATTITFTYKITQSNGQASIISKYAAIALL